MTSGGSGAWRSRGSRDAMPKPVSRTLPAASTSTFAGLMSLWMRPRWWTWRSAADREMARRRNLPISSGSAEQPVERLAAGILEQQHGPPRFAHELQRPHRPRPVQFVLQPVFVRQPINEAGRGMLRGREDGQHGGPLTVAAIPPSSAQDALAVLLQYLEITIPARAEPEGRVHLTDSVAKPVAIFRLETHWMDVRPEGAGASLKREPTTPEAGSRCLSLANPRY